MFKWLFGYIYIYIYIYISVWVYEYLSVWVDIFIHVQHYTYIYVLKICVNYTHECVGKRERNRWREKLKEIEKEREKEREKASIFEFFLSIFDYIIINKWICYDIIKSFSNWKSSRQKNKKKKNGILKKQTHIFVKCFFLFKLASRQINF